MDPFIELEEEVKKAGKRAALLQRNVLRDYKHDGSVLTEADLEINKTLSGTIQHLFPEANIIAEEQETPFVSGREWTFTLDPIDGTDAYSQGLPGWCVAVGIHNSELEPVGGIISAPRWGIDPQLGLYISRVPGSEDPGPNEIPNAGESGGRATSLMIGSKVHKRYDFSSYPGKIRSIGSSILHALSTFIYSDVAAAVLTPLYIWDLSAAHGIFRNRGVEALFSDGSKAHYETMVHRQRSPHCLFIVRDGMAPQIFRHFIPITPKQ